MFYMGNKNTPEIRLVVRPVSFLFSGLEHDVNNFPDFANYVISYSVTVWN